MQPYFKPNRMFGKLVLESSFPIRRATGIRTRDRKQHRRVRLCVKKIQIALLGTCDLEHYRVVASQSTKRGDLLHSLEKAMIQPATRSPFELRTGRTGKLSINMKPADLTVIVLIFDEGLINSE